MSKLGRYDQNAVDGADQLNVEAAYSAVYSVLLDEGLVTWASADDVPDKYTVPIVGLVASYLKPDYLIPLSPDDLNPIPYQANARLLRRQLSAPYVPVETPIQAY